MFVREYNFIRCRSLLLLFGNLLVILIGLIILRLGRLFLVIPRLNRLLVRGTHGFCWLRRNHFLHVFGTHASRLLRSTDAISIGRCLRSRIDFWLEEGALWMRLWRLKSVWYLIALAIFALVFVEVKWFSYRLRNILGRLRMHTKLNRMWHRHIWVVRGLDLQLLIQARLLSIVALIRLLTTHYSMSWTTSCSPHISRLLICWALRCISSIIQMLDTVSWWRRLEKEVVLHLLTHDIFVTLDISLSKTASILNCWSRVNCTIRLLLVLHSLIFLVVQLLLVHVRAVLVS